MPQHTVRYVTSLFIIVIITIACFNMAFVMIDGLPVQGSIASRMAFLSQHTLQWQLGWLTWMASAFGLLTFCSFLLPFIEPKHHRALGFSLVAIGIAPDITAEAMYAFVLPEVQNPEMFALLERIAILLTGVIGNTAYCLGGLLLNLLLLHNTALPRSIIYFGLPSWVIGLCIGIALLLGQPQSAGLFTAVAMVWNVLWMFVFTLRVLHPKRYQQVACYA